MSPTDPPAQPPADLEALTREIDRLSRRATESDSQLEELWNIVRAMADRLSGAAERDPGRSWLLQVGSSEPDKTVEMLADLVKWLDAVYLRYPGSELPACWMWHPWVVEELLWLRASHAEAYAARTWGVPAGMWHDQQRPRVVERIRPLLSSCDLSKHEPAGQAAVPPIAAPLGGHAHAVAASWISQGLPPEPTAAQLADATSYDDVLDNRI